MSLLAQHLLVGKAPWVSLYKNVLQYAIDNGIQCPSERMKRYHNLVATKLTDVGAAPSSGVFYMFFNDCGMDFARINWFNPSLYYLPSPAVPPYWVSRVGVSGRTDHDAEWYVDTGYVPGTSFTQNDAGIYLAALSKYGGGGVFAFNESNPNVDRSMAYMIDENAGIAINGASGAVANILANYNAAHGFERTISTQTRYRRNGSSIGTVTSTSTTPPATTFKILGSTNGATPSYNSSPIACNLPLQYLLIGASITGPNQVTIDTAVQVMVDRFLYAEQLNSSGNYTVPAGITSILVECLGAGGAGRGYPASVQTTTGGGGGGGAYSASVISVTPGDIIPYIVGAGGTPTTGAGGNGGDTSWNGGVVLAKGGSGAGTTPTTPAAGGAAGSGTGTTKHSGGAGGQGGTALTWSTGGGGSGAGALSDGFAGIDAVSGRTFSSRSPIALFGPGNPGASAQNTWNGIGATGSFGSGGGGARRTSSSFNGGLGGGGYVRISAYLA